MSGWIEKPTRIVDEAAVKAARYDFCEWCGRSPEGIHVHHHKSRGSGGHDEHHNLVSLCWVCHDLVHRAIISRDAMTEFLLMRGQMDSRRCGDGYVLCLECKEYAIPIWNGYCFRCRWCKHPMTPLNPATSTA
jgi:hypothetical protein